MAADAFAPLRARLAEKHPLIFSVLVGEPQQALHLVRHDPAAVAAATCCRGFTVTLAAVLADAGELVAALYSAGLLDFNISRDISWQTLSMTGGKFATPSILSMCDGCRTVFSLAMRLGRPHALEVLLPILVAAPSSSVGTWRDDAFLQLASNPLTTEQKLTVVRQMLELGLDPLQLNEKMTGVSPLCIFSDSRDSFKRQAALLMLDAVLQRDQQQQAQHAQQQPRAQLGPRAAGSTPRSGSGSGTNQQEGVQSFGTCQLLHAVLAALCLNHPQALDHFLLRLEAAVARLGQAPGSAQGGAAVAAGGVAPAAAAGGAAHGARLGREAGDMLPRALRAAVGGGHLRAVLRLLAIGAGQPRDTVGHAWLLLHACRAKQWEVAQLLIAAEPAAHMRAVIAACDGRKPRDLALLLHWFGPPPEERARRQQLQLRRLLLEAGQQLPPELSRVAIEDQDWWQPALPALPGVPQLPQPHGNAGNAQGLRQAVKTWLAGCTPLYSLLWRGQQGEPSAEVQQQRQQCAMVLLRAGYSADELRRAVDRFPALAEQLHTHSHNSRLWELCTSEPGALDWSPATHSLYPSSFRAATRAVLLAAKAQEQRRLAPAAAPLLGGLPEPLVHRVLQLAAQELHEWL